MCTVGESQYATLGIFHLFYHFRLATVNLGSRVSMSRIFTQCLLTHLVFAVSCLYPVRRHGGRGQDSTCGLHDAAHTCKSFERAIFFVSCSRNLTFTSPRLHRRRPAFEMVGVGESKKQYFQEYAGPMPMQTSFARAISRYLLLQALK